MDIRQARAAFDKEGKIYDSALLTFVGVDGYDVYTCSVCGQTYKETLPALEPTSTENTSGIASSSSETTTE